MRNREFGIRSWQRYVALLLGMVLLLAAFLKAHEGVTHESSQGGDDSSLFRFAWLIFEFLLGLFLVTGLYRRTARYVGIGAFVVLAFVALLKALGGAESCGCFGQVAVNPWLIVGFDLSAVFLLSVLPPSPEREPQASPLRGIISAAAATLTSAVVALLVLAWFPTSSLTDEGEVIGDGRVVALDPNVWPQRRFPLLRHVDVGGRLANGEWVVVLHREKCEACREAIPAYLALAHDLERRGSPCRVALVELPPWTDDAPATPAGSPCLRGRVSDAHEWQIRTPLFLSLKAGTVESVTSDPTALLETEKTPAESMQARTSGRAILAFPDYRQARRNRYLSEIACGPLSLLAVLRSLGVHVSAEKEERLLNEAGDRGIDLLRLKELAEDESVHALGVALPASELARLGLAAVIHDGGFGFAAVTDCSVDGLRLVRPFKPAVVLTPAELEKQYGASIKALLLSRKPLDSKALGVVSEEDAKVHGPWLRCERSVISVGRIYKQAWDATLTVRNAGDGARSPAEP